MEKNIKVVVVAPGEYAEVKTIPNELKSFQELVGGYIEVVKVGKDILMVLNEEGKLMNLEPSFGLGNDVIVGTVLFCTSDGEEFGSLTDEQAEAVIEFVDERREF